MSLICPCCSGTNFKTVHVYNERPDGETEFPGIDVYRREVLQCEGCGHFLSRHEMLLDDLYEEQYVDSTYGDEAGIRSSFERIMGLPPEGSDNIGRVNRVIEKVESVIGRSSEMRLLDVGSGLGVFPAALQRQKDWSIWCIEPDERYTRHIQEIGIENTIVGDFFAVEFQQKFNVITLNKVLEHVDSPGDFLRKCSDLLEAQGLIYVEIPDATGALEKGAGFFSEEFFIEHPHIFTETSLDSLVRALGLKHDGISTFKEPSGKCTMATFLTLE